MRKLQPLIIKGVKNSKKTIEHYKRLIPKHPKNSYYIALLLLKSKDDL
jgi:hypothetical protein